MSKSTSSFRSAVSLAPQEQETEEIANFSRKSSKHLDYTSLKTEVISLSSSISTENASEINSENVSSDPEIHEELNLEQAPEVKKKAPNYGAFFFVIICILSATLVMIIFWIEYTIEKKPTEQESIVMEELEQNETEPGCEFIALVSDGYCDDEANTKECNFDFGDCCDWQSDFTTCQECFCYTDPINYTNKCEGFWDVLHSIPGFLGEGYCDSELNNVDFFFDAGDCCYDDSADWSVCIKSDRYCIQDQIGDGVCQDHNNGPLCEYDLGDCCMTKNTTRDFCCDCRCPFAG